MVIIPSMSVLASSVQIASWRVKYIKVSLMRHSTHHGHHSKHHHFVSHSSPECSSSVLPLFLHQIILSASYYQFSELEESLNVKTEWDLKVISCYLHFILSRMFFVAIFCSLPSLVSIHKASPYSLPIPSNFS